MDGALRTHMTQPVALDTSWKSWNVLLLGNPSCKRTWPVLAHGAEFSALGMALRAGIPLLEVIHDVIQSFDAGSQAVTRFLTTVHKDNQAAFRLAQMEKGHTNTPLKFYAIKLHWFRSWLKPKEIELKYIES
jgi:hypothetical protein